MDENRFDEIERKLDKVLKFQERQERIYANLKEEQGRKDAQLKEIQDRVGCIFWFLIAIISLWILSFLIGQSPF